MSRFCGAPSAFFAPHQPAPFVFCAAPRRPSLALLLACCWLLLAPPLLPPLLLPLLLLLVYRSGRPISRKRAFAQADLEHAN